MRRPSRTLAIVVASIGLWMLDCTQLVLAQTVNRHKDSLPHIVLIKLSPPTYPSIARQALIEDDVVLKIVIHPNGSIGSVSTISGHRLLVASAVDSAKQSQFKCLGCGVSDVDQTFTYSFHVSRKSNPDPNCCSNNRPATAEVSQSDNKISITSGPACYCH